MRPTSELYRRVKAYKSQYERSYPIPFQPLLPIKLRDRVSNKVIVSKERPCVPELTVLLQCFKDYDFNETRCAEVTKSYYACIQRFNDAHSDTTEGRDSALIKTTKELTPEEVTKLLKKNPQV